MGELSQVVVLGTGLIGTSVALALTESGVAVWLKDPDPTALRLACDLGAGRPLAEAPSDAPADVAVIAAPPDAVPGLLHRAQHRGLAQVYTDVASVKQWVVGEAERRGCDTATFVPGHPMGGSERTGPGAARADLFLGRPWAICPTAKTDPAATAAVRRLAEAGGAIPMELAAAEHDRAVALVSHAPHVAAAAIAARLAEGPEAPLALSGQGVRDVTRIAAGDPALWQEILRHNAAEVADVLAACAGDLHAAAEELRAAGPGGTVAGLLERGRQGQGRIPGKHGHRPDPGQAVLPVVIPDEPGALARLFASAERVAVNIEDVRIDHSPGLPVGVAQLWVRDAELQRLAEGLAADGWSVHG